MNACARYWPRWRTWSRPCRPKASAPAAGCASAPVSFGILHLGPAIAEYLQQYPDVVIDLDLNDRVVDLVEDGYDVAVRIGPLQDSSLVARPLAPQRLLVCASPDYLRRNGTPATPEDLKQHRCLHYAYASTGNEWHFEKDGQVAAARRCGPTTATCCAPPRWPGMASSCNPISWLATTCALGGSPRS